LIASAANPIKRKRIISSLLASIVPCSARVKRVRAAVKSIVSVKTDT
jgi:hypothetical protein